MPGPGQPGTQPDHDEDEEEGGEETYEADTALLGSPLSMPGLFGTAFPIAAFAALGLTMLARKS